MSEALGIGRPQPFAQGGGTVIAAMAALVADGLCNHACGRASVVALMTAPRNLGGGMRHGAPRVFRVKTTGP
jgi:hypothetical protein